MKPTVGHIVHYVSYGSTVLPDGTQRYTPQCRAAIVTEVEPSEGDGSLANMNGPEPVSLAFLGPTDIQGCRHSEGAKTGGTWHFPERVGE